MERKKPHCPTTWMRPRLAEMEHLHSSRIPGDRHLEADDWRELHYDLIDNLHYNFPALWRGGAITYDVL